jgi:tRNA A64-2'-O-ribosylphosphate transferase
MNSEAYLFLNIPDGKKGGVHFLKSIPVLLNFVKSFIRDKKRILIHGRYGN